MNIRNILLLINFRLFNVLFVKYKKGSVYFIEKMNKS